MPVELVVEEHFDEAIAKIDNTAKDRMAQAVDEVRNTTLNTLSGQRSGRIYRVPGTQRYYTASAPGEPPAVQLGDLRRSVKTEVEQEGMVGFVGTDLLKGPMLEFGTRHIAPRPWLRISFEKSLDKVKEIFTRNWL